MTDINKLRKTKKWLQAQEQQLVDVGVAAPADFELEAAVLGALMLEKDAIMHMAILRPEHFYKQEHFYVFAAIYNLNKANTEIDILTVSRELRRTEKLDLVGGPLFVSQITSRVASAANIETHIHILIELWMRRELMRIGQEMESVAPDDSMDVFNLVDTFQQRFLTINDSLNAKQSISVAHLLLTTLKRIMDNANKRGLTGCPTGYYELDILTGGWQPADLVIVGGRPGMGKTAVAINMAFRAAKHYGKQVLFCSLEMSNAQCLTRMIAMVSSATGTNITASHLTEREWQMMHTTVPRELENMTNLVLDDTPQLTIMQLQSKAFRMKMTQGLDLIVVDYLQLMRGEGFNREAEIGSISRGLKALAKFLNVPIIAMAQLSRGVETRGGAKRPSLADLRESGAIEQDADIVMFPYRPEYYGIKEDAEGNPLVPGYGELIVAKHRNGGLADIPCRMILGCNRVLGRIPTDNPHEIRFDREEVYLGQPLWQQLNEAPPATAPPAQDAPY